MFFQLYADVATWFSKKGGGGGDNKMVRIISYRHHPRLTFPDCHIEKPGTAAVAGTRILVLERQ